MKLTSGLDQCREPLASLVGPEAAEQALLAWQTEQSALVDDDEFAARFRSHFEHYQARPRAFSHRWFEAGCSEVLGGIRFYGGDSSRAFVEIITWEGQLKADELARVVAEEWRDFKPTVLRLLVPFATKIPGSRLDQSIHAARCSKIAANSGDITLQPVDAIEPAHDIVKKVYSDVARDRPSLSPELFAATRQELSDCKQFGTLDYICTLGECAGVIATMPGRIAFLTGNVIVEEAVLSDFAGRGLARHAQGALADALMARDDNGKNPLLIGTIHRENHASRITAERAGRAALFEYRFLALPSVG